MADDDDIDWWAWYRAGDAPSWSQVVTSPPPASHRHLVRVRVAILDPDDLGFARATEDAALRRATDRVWRTLQEQLGARPLALLHGEGHQELLFTLDRPSGWRRAIEAARAACPHHQWHAHLEDGTEAAWAAVAPSEDLLKQLPHFEEIDHRWAMGDNPDAVRPVTFTLLVPTADARSQAAAAAKAAGFDLDDLDDGTDALPFGLDIVGQHALWEVPETVEALNALLGPVGGRVRDWGAPQAPHPEPRIGVADPAAGDAHGFIRQLGEVGPYPRRFTHRATFAFADRRDAFLAHAGHLGFFVIPEDPPEGSIPVGRPFVGSFSREDQGDAMLGIVADLQDLVAFHDGRYVDLAGQRLPRDSGVAHASFPPATPVPTDTAAGWRRALRNAPAGGGEPAYLGLRGLALLVSLIAPGAGHAAMGHPILGLVLLAAYVALVASQQATLAPFGIGFVAFPPADHGEVFAAVHVLAGVHAAWLGPVLPRDRVGRAWTAGVTLLALATLAWPLLGSLSGR